MQPRNRTTSSGWRLTANGWLSGVRRWPSPNQDARPPGTRINLLVIHAISLPPGCFGGPHIDQLFSNTLDPKAHPCFEELRRQRVSAHLLITRDGALTQYVALSRRAWHAGVSVFREQPRCNDYSIGVELEGSPEHPYETVQYRRLVELSFLLMRHYPGITPERVMGHCHIAPERKQDPYQHFDWIGYRAQLGGNPAQDPGTPAPGTSPKKAASEGETCPEAKLGGETNATSENGEPDRI